MVLHLFLQYVHLLLQKYPLGSFNLLEHSAPTEAASLLLFGPFIDYWLTNKRIDAFGYTATSVESSASKPKLHSQWSILIHFTCMTLPPIQLRASISKFMCTFINELVRLSTSCFCFVCWMYRQTMCFILLCFCLRLIMTTTSRYKYILLICISSNLIENVILGLYTWWFMRK